MAESYGIWFLQSQLLRFSNKKYSPLKRSQNGIPWPQPYVKVHDTSSLKCFIRVLSGKRISQVQGLKILKIPAGKNILNFLMSVASSWPMFLLKSGLLSAQDHGLNNGSKPSEERSRELRPAKAVERDSNEKQQNFGPEDKDVATNPEDPRSTPRTHMMEGENKALQVPLTSIHARCKDTHTHTYITHTHTYTHALMNQNTILKLLLAYTLEDSSCIHTYIYSIFDFLSGSFFFLVFWISFFFLLFSPMLIQKINFKNASLVFDWWQSSWCPSHIHTKNFNINQGHSQPAEQYKGTRCCDPTSCFIDHVLSPPSLSIMTSFLVLYLFCFHTLL